MWARKWSRKKVDEKRGVGEVKRREEGRKDYNSAQLQQKAKMESWWSMKFDMPTESEVEKRREFMQWPTNESEVALFTSPNT